jgi:GR25 family glycosyltransferase involved in LPS biosynthesis
MSLIVVRNYIHKDLVELTKTSYDELLISGENYLYGIRLLEKVFFQDNLQSNYDYICFVDEDCIVSNFDSIIKMMDETDVDVVGVPDGNCVDMRVHRPDVPNLFFVIIKTKKMQNLSFDEYNEFNVSVGYAGETFNYDTYEPYYKFFCYIKYKLNCNFFYLNAKTSKFDNATTEVFFDDKLFAAHTWYSRFYDYEDTKKRIDESIQYYKNFLFNRVTLPFDKVYCLHLVEAENRLDHLKNEFSRLGILQDVEIWWSCKHPKVLEICNFLHNTNQFYWNGLGNGGAFNCTREHYQMVKTAYLRGYNSICIIEDDITFTDDVELIKRVFNSIPNDYDILRISYHIRRGLIYPSIPELFIEDDTMRLWGTQMYALSRAGMKYYIEYVDNNYCVADAPLYDVDAIQKYGLKNYLYFNNDLIIRDNEINNHTFIQD